MKTIVYIGGVGNSSRTVNAAVRALSLKCEANVVGMSLTEARKNRDVIARLAPVSTIVTHSAGMTALRGIVPKKLIAVAPPMPALPIHLMLRSFPKAYSLFTSGRGVVGRSRRAVAYSFNCLGEHVLRPRHNSRALKEMGTFNAAQRAVEMKRSGAEVTLIFMEDDRLFPDVQLHPHIEIAQQQGVKIHAFIGHHDEFALYPLETLALFEGAITL